jgi:hypothetical protein
LDFRDRADFASREPWGRGRSEFDDYPDADMSFESAMPHEHEEQFRDREPAMPREHEEPFRDRMPRQYDRSREQFSGADFGPW